jgi:non-homologous end joining protein Ku
MTSDWEPEKYQNSYLLALQEIIEQKLQQKPAMPKAHPAKKEMVGDILAILQQSLVRTAGKKQQQRPARTKRTSTTALVTRKRGGVAARN